MLRPYFGYYEHVVLAATHPADQASTLESNKKFSDQIDSIDDKFW